MLKPTFDEVFMELASNKDKNKVKEITEENGRLVTLVNEDGCIVIAYKYLDNYWMDGSLLGGHWQEVMEKTGLVMLWLCMIGLIGFIGVLWAVS